MKKSLLQILRCPACFSELRDEIHEQTADVIVEARLECTGCGCEFYIREAAAYLGVLDSAWATILKELINRRVVIEDDFRAGEIRVEDRSEKLAEQDAIAERLADDLFAAAKRYIDFSTQPRILDCGAGMFDTSSWFAEQGAEVVATETEMSMVRYSNFADVFPQPPQMFEINGRECSWRNPWPFPKYFSRVVSDIHRMPFAPGSFDIAFCRAMLHHVDDPSAAVRELARMVKPGGWVLICAEPTRSIFDKESDYIEDVVHREEGMNEQTPTLLAYRRPLAELSEKVFVQYWQQPPRFRTKKFFNLLPYKYEKHLTWGEEIKNWKWIKLLPIAGGVNLYGQRNTAESTPRKAIANPESRVTLKDIADVYINNDSEMTIDAIHSGTDQLKKIRRRLLANMAEKFPTAFEPGAGFDMLLLESGWGVAENNSRFLLKRASIVLRIPDNAKELVITASAGRPDWQSETQIQINGIPQTEIKATGEQPQKFRFPITPEIQTAGHSKILHIEFTSAKLNNHQTARSKVGSAIARLNCL